MTTSDFLYKNSRPKLTIEHIGGALLGNCYSASYYRVTSSGKRLGARQLQALWDADLLGMGQEWNINSKCDGTEDPAGQDEVPCVEFIRGIAQPGPAINPYSQKPYLSMLSPYYQYDVECRCDSGD